MAVQLNGTTDYLANGSPPVQGTPYTMSCWFYDTVPVGANGVLMMLTRSTSAWWGAYLVVTNAQQLFAVSVANTSFTYSGTATGAYSTSQWNHAAGVWASTTSRTAYLNGVAATTDTTSKNPISGGNFSHMVAGASYVNGLIENKFDGRVADCAIWNAALDAHEIAALSKGVCPLLVRPASLQNYWPLHGRRSPEPDLRQGSALTLYGSPSYADHPRIYYPAGAMTVGQATAPTSYTLTAAQGSYTLAGQDAGLLAARLLTAGHGSYTLTGQDAGLLAARLLSAGCGSYALTGQDAGLLAARLLTAGHGSYTLTGQDAGLLAARLLGAAQGSFALTGQDAGLLAARLLSAFQGSFTLTGQDAGLLAARRLLAEYGSYALTGQDAGLLIARALAALAGGVFTRLGTARGFGSPATSARGMIQTDTTRGISRTGTERQLTRTHTGRGIKKAPP